MDLDAIFADYRANGYARLGPVLDEVELVALRERADAIMRGEVTLPGLFFQHDAGSGRYEDLELGRGWVGPSLEYRKIEKLELDDRFLAVIRHPRVEPLVRAWIGGDVVLYRAILMTKGEGGGTYLPFHQDGGTFWGLDRDPDLQIWFALDDAPPEAGCVEIVPGTHRGGLATPLGGVIPDDLLAAADADARAIPVPARAGEALLIHNHVWHRSRTNTTGRPRRGFSVCYMPATTRCRRKKRAPRTFFPVFTG